MLKKSHRGLAVSAVLSGLALLGLTLCPAETSAAAGKSIELCVKTILPSLFPFMVVGSLLVELGLTASLSRLFSPLMEKLFGVSGAGCGAFFLGLTGGYPMGAASVCQLYKNGELQKDEAERLLGFCDNTGPAFIVGVAGGAVFGSPKAGILLYGIHIISAVLTGMLLCWRERGVVTCTLKLTPRMSLPKAFSVSVKRSVSVCAAVCGFVVFFGVVLGLLEACGALPALIGSVAAKTGLELKFVRSLLTGFLELGGGISSMAGLRLCGANLALAAFILGFGGLSVHAQAYSEIAEGGLSAVRHLFGKLLHGALSALITLLAFPVFF